ncbi:MAG: outer membrane lipoprotein-sorting protein [Gammaproteobacteria bacterium]|nr:outer membrane lipoprotein-sorting protein [Gammaproteobacteria bacterium]
MRRLLPSFILAIVSFGYTQLLWAQTAEERGLEIAEAADAYDAGYGDFTAEMLMVLKNKKGHESVRVMRNRTLEGIDDGDKSLSIFDQPRDVKGTASLTYSHGLKSDDQWLYLPALKRVKRINSRNKSGPFLGSEFAFEDIGSQEVEKFSYQLLREEKCGDWDCYVIERKPEYKYSGYTRQVALLDKTFYRVVKIDFYDRKNAHLKTLTYKGYQQYLDHYWRPDEMFMQNHLTGKSTSLKWSNYQFKTGLTEKDFRANALKRIR